MLSTKIIRHKLTKSPIIKHPLTWLQHRGLNPTDAFIASYPRAGSTWLRFMLFEILASETAYFESVDKTIAGVRNHFFAQTLLPNSGRLLQTHEPHRSEYLKAVYLVRDVRDVVVSEYFFCKRLGFYAGDFNGFFDRFIEGNANRYGFWGDHTNSWLDASDHQASNILLIKFEAMRQNPESTLATILSFLNLGFETAHIQEVVKNNTIKRMQEKEENSEKFKDNLDGIRFVNKGNIGDGNQFLSSSQLEILNNKTQKARKRLGY